PASSRRGAGSVDRRRRSGPWALDDLPDLRADPLDVGVGNVVEGVDDARVELGRGLLADQGPGVRDRAGRAVWALGGERVERVGDGEHPSGQGDRLAGEAVGIALPIPALVMGTDYVARRAQELHVANDLPPDHGMARHER